MAEPTEAGRRVVTPNARHQAFKLQIGAVFENFRDLPAEELLAIGAQMVGMLIAAQDKKTMTSARAAEIVNRNVQIGNQSAIDTSMGPAKGSA